MSNSYLTTEGPGNQELNIYNAETGQADTNAFEDTEPKVVDELIVSKEEYEEKETAVEEESPAYSWKFYVSCFFAMVCVIIIGIGIYNIVCNKKNGNGKK